PSTTLFRSRRGLHRGRGDVRAAPAEPVAVGLRASRVLPREHAGGGAVPPRSALLRAVRLTPATAVPSWGDDRRLQPYAHVGHPAPREGRLAGRDRGR